MDLVRVRICRLGLFGNMLLVKPNSKFVNYPCRAQLSPKPPFLLLRRITLEGRDASPILGYGLWKVLKLGLVCDNQSLLFQETRIILQKKMGTKTEGMKFPERGR